MRTAVAGALTILLVAASAGAQTAVRDTIWFGFQVDKQASTAPDSPTPAYPAHLRNQYKSGEVLARFVVDTTGRADMTTFQALKATDPGFVESVREALPRMRFIPAVRYGRPVKQLVQEPFLFRLGAP